MTIDPHFVAVDQHLVDVGIGHEDVEGAEPGHLGKRRVSRASRALGAGRQWSESPNGAVDQLGEVAGLLADRCAHGIDEVGGHGHAATRAMARWNDRGSRPPSRSPVSTERLTRTSQSTVATIGARIEVSMSRGRSAWPGSSTSTTPVGDDTEPTRTTHGEVAGAGDEPALGALLDERRGKSSRACVDHHRSAAVDAPFGQPVDQPVPSLRSHVGIERAGGSEVGVALRDDAHREERAVRCDLDQQVVDVGNRGIAAQPVDDAGSLGLGESEHRGDVAVEIDEQDGADRADGAGARDDRGAAAALGGVAERDHGFPQVGRAGRTGRGLGRESVLST